MISVICPIYNEEKYIAKCIDSILKQDYPHDEMEILFVDGMSQDNTRAIIYEYVKKHNIIRLLNNPKKIVPCAMNIGIRKSHGDIIIRIDAHATYATNYISSLIRNLKKLNCENIGAPCVTDVINKTKKSLAIKEVLSNRFGVGNSKFRIGVNKLIETDTVPFGCWPKETFARFGLFDERLKRNQDIELNKRIIKGGGHIFITPETSSIYYAREDFYALAKNNYNNGKWNILTVYYTNSFRSLSLRHFIPLLFLLSITIPLILSPIYWPLALLSLISLTAYITLICIISLKISIAKKCSFYYLHMAFTVLHISYGWGSFCGIIKTIYKK